MVDDYHLCWPDLDIDLEIDNLENPDKYPLKSKVFQKTVAQQVSRKNAAFQT